MNSPLSGRFVAVFGLALAFLASALSAQERISPEAFLDAALGKTLTFSVFPRGPAVGVEEFLRRDLSVWRETDGDCVYGEITINGDLLCFLYDFDRDGLPVCWATFRDGDNLFVASAPPGSVEIQKVTSITEDGLACPIKPGV